DLIPRRRIGHWHPQHRLVALHAIPWEAQVVATHRQHRPRSGAVFVLPSVLRKPGRKDLAARRATQLFQRVMHGTEQGMAVKAYLPPSRQLIQGALTAHWAALPHRQLLVAALDTRGPSIGCGP